MELVKHNNTILAKIINFTDQQAGKSTFFSEDEDFIQFAMHQPNKEQQFKPHYHQENIRTINKTQEVLLVISGRMNAKFYTEKGEFLEDRELKSGQAIILLNGAHGFEILTDDCQFLEIKNGPYKGAELDRKRI